MVLSCEQDAQTNHEINIANKSFENDVHFKYFGTRLTSEKSIQEETERRLNLVMLATIHSINFLLLVSSLKA
jgi:hypothetical protein